MVTPVNAAVFEHQPTRASKNMKSQETNRVLNRIGARELTPKEVGNVSGGLHTETACTFNAKTKHADGDVGEC
jgi:hypothetical protein